MYLNNILLKLQIFLLLSYLLIITLKTSTALATTNPKTNITLFLGDSNSKVTIDILKQFKTQKSLEKYNFYLLTTDDLKTQKASIISNSKIVIFFIMNKQNVMEVKEYIIKAKEKQAKVFGIGAPISDELINIGIEIDKEAYEYFEHGGYHNIKNMILYILNKYDDPRIKFDKIKQIPKHAIYDHKTKKIYEDYETYIKNTKKPTNTIGTAGIIIYKNSYTSNQLEHIDYLIDKLRKNKIDTITIYGYPVEQALEKYFLNEKGKPRVDIIIAVGSKLGINPNNVLPILQKINVPIINAITLFRDSRKTWEESNIGINISERTWQVALQELLGYIEPTVFATRERVNDNITGLNYIIEKPIPHRVDMLVNRVKAIINLQKKQNAQKNIAIIYYNYPPGKNNIGASYLNVLPESLYYINEALLRHGFNTHNLSKEELFTDIMNFSRNIGNWAPAELERLVTSGKPILIPIETYKKWLLKLPETLRNFIIERWGMPENAKIMLWTNKDGRKFLVLPALRYGNIIYAPQPSRGLEQDVQKLYHDLKTPPHHQYLAFYLYLQEEFKADAVIHVGRHGTHEWLPTREVGLNNDDAPEALIAHIPNIYIYIVDGLGEGLQAKRRGMATIIDHLTPPFDKATLQNEYKEILNLIEEFNVIKDKSPTLSQAKLNEINNHAKKHGFLTDLSLSEIKSTEDLERLEHFLKEIHEKNTPFGLYTFGRGYDDDYLLKTAEAMISYDENLTPEERAKRIEEYSEKIRLSARLEIENLIKALEGKFIPPGPGNDPLRNPNVLPTGKNFYAHDPRKMPSKSTYELGKHLAQELIQKYLNEKGTYPDKVSFNLWAVETVRHEGVMESQILYLLGFRPVWEKNGNVRGVEPIPKNELNRPRIDVTIIPSGLYRDLFPNLMQLIDQAITLASNLDEDDNYIKRNSMALQDELIRSGFDPEMAKRLSLVRFFTTPVGDYGTRLDKVIPMSHTWDDETQVVDVFFSRMSHLYGQGFWGDKVLSMGNNGDTSLYLLKNALKGTKILVHSRATNLYGTLDNDDFFQYMGGTSMAIKHIDGKTPELFVTDMSNPKKARQETLQRFMGKELKARYLNPKWINEMLNEGYAGARFIDKVVEHLWGWQVTNPEVVDEAKWQAIYETYVLDKHGLNIKERFRNANNLFAYQSIVARMLETIRKGYWKADEEVVNRLSKEFAETAKETGLACCDHTCANPLLSEFTANALIKVPGLQELAKDFKEEVKRINDPSMPARQIEVKPSQIDQSSQKEFIKRDEKAEINKEKAPENVKGYEIEEINKQNVTRSAQIPYIFILVFVLAVVLFLMGFKRR